MATQGDPDRLTHLQGTLDLLILRTLRLGRQHGQGIARAIQEQSEDVLLVEHRALYPALQRLEAKGWIAAEWAVSSNNRRARFYTLTKDGRKQLVQEASRWRTISARYRARARSGGQAELGEPANCEWTSQVRSASTATTAGAIDRS